MPPCLDVYVWLPECSSEVLGRFIESYVNAADDDERLHTLIRAHTQGGADDVSTLYLKARDHYQASITFTRDGATVLGLSVDAPDDLPETLRLAEQLMEQLRQQFAAPAGCAGVELPPAGDRSEWHEEALVLLRTGELTF
ncbi:hypothetical protein [Nonomuraea sp. NPDC049725]|uniref:hypothetical protein n=1 Tax=Nonomuraea sp. NPDC049725 TaxID=3154508 RepID=UPI00344617AD